MNIGNGILNSNYICGAHIEDKFERWLHIANEYYHMGRTEEAKGALNHLSRQLKSNTNEHFWHAKYLLVRYGNYFIDLEEYTELKNKLIEWNEKYEAKIFEKYCTE